MDKIKKLLELLTADLDIYTCVRMARKDLYNNNFQNAVSRLLVDIDKYNVELYNFIMENRK